MRHHAISSVFLIVACAQLTNAQSFHLIQPLPGDLAIRPQGISADGSTVFGLSQLGSNNQNQAFRWRLATGTQGLGDFPGGILNSAAYGCSATGEVVTGSGTSAGGQIAFRWTSGTGMLPINDSGLPIFGMGTSISEDGQTIAGTRNGGGFVWSAVSGVVDAPTLPGEFQPATIGAMSGNAAWIWLTKNTAPHIYRWDRVHAPIAVSNWQLSIRVMSCSRDGLWATGVQGDFPQYMGVRCPAANYPQPLGSFQIGDTLTSSSSANAISADASTVVGDCTSSGTPPNFTRAMIWTADTGIQDLNAVAMAAGVDLQGYTLVSAVGVSSNGSTITGIAQFGGVGPQVAYYLQLPPKCDADFNHDGAIDFFDYLDFVDAYSIGC